jgi:uncharacterized protein
LQCRSFKHPATTCCRLATADRNLRCALFGLGNSFDLPQFDFNSMRLLQSFKRFWLVLAFGTIEDVKMEIGFNKIRAAFYECVLAFALLFSIFSPLAHAEDSDNPITGFFSFLPAPPHLTLPHLDLTPFWTDDLKTARRAYSNRDYGRARDYFQKSSDDGNIVANWYLGHMYRLGRGVPANPAVAYSYFSRVADNFNPDEGDQNRLRIMIDGQLRVADYERTGISAAKLKANPQAAARTYMQMATNYGHPHALYALGAMNIMGEGMRKNPQQGLKWLNTAARKHSPEAAAYLGDLYAKGGVVAQDDVRALTWYLIAAHSANPDDNPYIMTNLNTMKASASEDVQLEAEARARVWNEQNPEEPKP